LIGVGGIDSGEKVFKKIKLGANAVQIYSSLIYNGFWFSPEREMLQAAIDKSQKNVSGTVRAKLYKGNVIITGRKSPFSLYSESLVTFEEGTADYNHSDAEGFIKLNALRLRVKKMIENSK